VFAGEPKNYSYATVINLIAYCRKNAANFLTVADATETPGGCTSSVISVRVVSFKVVIKWHYVSEMRWIEFVWFALNSK